jgi:pimeloyl-ACP methyl ester carboxylesterase
LRKIIKPTDTVFMAVSVAAFGPHASAKQIDFTYDMLADTPMDVIFDLIKSYRDFEVTDHLSQLTVPALVIGGTHDRLTIPKASEHLAENLPKAELKILQGCGHMSMLERHRELNKTLEGFFDDVLGAERKVSLD